jgi:ABC-type branched-subunit amino acid transport system substrate-binding protein
MKYSFQQSRVGMRSTTAPACALVVACALTQGSPVVAAPGDKAAVVRTLAGRVGSVVGAASSCQNIGRARIQTVVDKFSMVIKDAASNEQERASIAQLLDRSVADGRRALTSAQTDCGTTERQFADLEQSIGVSAADTTFAPLTTFQPAAPVPVGPPTTQTAAVPSLSGSAVRGVTDREIRFGIVAPFSGASKELGRQMKLGIDAAFNRANDDGGIAGRKLRLIAADDGYEQSRTLGAMAQLYDNEQVFGFIGNVGTPTAAVAAPFAMERRTLFFGGFTGSPVLRRDPPDRYVFNYRASLAEEVEASVRFLVKVRRLRPQQIAVLVQDDAFGELVYGGVTKVMRTLGAGDGMAAHLQYKRNSIDVTDAIGQLALRKGAIKAIVVIGTYRTAAKLIERTHDLYPGMIYTNISIVGSSELAEELKLLGPKYSNGVIVTQVVPAVDAYSSAILEYKAALAKYFPGEAPGYVSLEGYIGANLLIQALKQTGPQLDTERLVDSLESIRGLDMGLGTRLSYGRSEHQGSHKVWGTALDENGRYQAIDLD